MKSICFFSSYYDGEKMPYYVKFYLTELSRHFSEVIFLVNEKTISPEDIQFLSSNNIPYRTYKNEGYDFGMWYKAFKEYDLKVYDRVGLVNDSCILFNNLNFYFDWLNKQDIDYGGLTDCNLIKYHIQSYFIVINKKAIQLVAEYFSKNGIVKNVKDVIMVYEINLCDYLREKGMQLKAYYPIKEKSMANPSWIGVKDLIKDGLPLIKKKIIVREYGDADWKVLAMHGFDPIPNHYIKLIKKVMPNSNIDELLIGLPIQKNFIVEMKYYAIAVISKIYGIYKKIKRFIYVMVYGDI
jgi:lipopolysaccharide biosynthesis protein